MKLSIDKAHKDFFQKEGWIAFDDLLSEAQLRQLNQTIDEALKVRFDLPIDKVNTLKTQELFAKGRDLSRFNQKLRKIVTQPNFAEVACELVEIRSVRLGYDQLIPAEVPNPFSPKESYTLFIEQATTLAEISCVKEVVAGLLICLGPQRQIDSTAFAPGHVIFFRPDSPLHFSQLQSQPGQRYLLIVYTEKQAYYKLEPRDPQTHELKNLGYVFNDKLRDKTHPVVLSR